MARYMLRGCIMEMYFETFVTDVDKEDVERLLPYNWKLDMYSLGYIYAYSGGCRLWMHRLILNLRDGEGFVDHINGDKLDNRKENLRVCSPQQNAFNRSKTTSKRSSIYKGVSWHKTTQLYFSNIKYNGISIFLYRSKIEQEAAFAYNVAAKLLAKDFAKLNDIEFFSSEVEYSVKQRLYERGLITYNTLVKTTAM